MFGGVLFILFDGNGVQANLYLYLLTNISPPDMFVQYLLPLLYLLLGVLFIIKCQWLKHKNIRVKWVLFFFMAKCLAGVVNNWVAFHYFPNQGDIWLFFNDGLAHYRAFFQRPASIVPWLRETFFLNDVAFTNTESDFVRSAFEGIKFLHLILNFFSGGNFYTNTILFNGLSILFFLRCWVFLKSETGSWVAGAWLFLFPSAFFYSSAIHKEGIVLVLIAILLPLIAGFFKSPSFFKSLLILFFSALLLFIKIFVAVFFFGGVIIWFLLLKFPQHKIKLVLGLTATSILVFFGSAWLDIGFNLPAIIIGRQHEFLALEAASSIDLPVLEPNFWSYFKSLPSALGNVFFKPLLGRGGGLRYLPFAFEIAVFWALIIAFALRSGFKMQFFRVSAFIAGMAIFAFAYLLVIGYTIPNLGANTRYRSIFIPFLGLFFYMVFNGNKTMKPLFKKWFAS